MPSFMVMVQDENGKWEGLGERHFEVPPQKGDLITDSDENGQAIAYAVLGIIHPMDGASTAGDLIIKLVGKGYEEYRNAVTKLW